MIIHFTEDIDDDSITLRGDEAQHCAKVLRKRVGDEIYVTDGKGTLHTCKIAEISKSECTASILHSELMEPRSYHLTISICPTKKQSRIEWFVEKAVEIGVSRIILTQTKRTEKSRLKEERITDCTWNDLINRTDLGHRYIAHCENPDKHLAKVYPVAEDCVGKKSI